MSLPIYLLHIQVVAARDLCARCTHQAWRCSRSCGIPVCAQAIEAFGEQTGAGRLTNAAHPREQERMRHAAAVDGIRERARDVLLTDEFRKRLRAILASKDNIRHVR